MSLNTLFFGVYPYICLTVFVIGSWIRYDNEQYTWKTDSSMLLSRDNMLLASNLFHVGILMLFLGHFAGMVLPHGFWVALGVSDLAHQWLAIWAGLIFGSACLAGGVMLWRRRMFNPRIRKNSRRADIFVLSWLLLTLILGLLTIPFSIGHANKGDPSVMLALGEWVRSILVLNPKPELMAQADPIFRAHIFFGLTVFLIFPFTRLVHILTAPFNYAVRAYQIVRTKRPTHTI